MLRPRIIPCLLVQGGGLVKTVRFGSPKYVGDPLNAVRIFNEKEVDELMVVDIDATTRDRTPDYTLIKNLAAECRMPLCYGGGVRSVQHVEKIIGMGVEKVAVSSAAVASPELVGQLARVIGRQSIVVVIDVKQPRPGKYEVWTHNGSQRIDTDPVALACRMEQLGAGEIVLNSIDNDGVMKGYDFELVSRVRNAVGLPLTVLGGAGALDHIHDLFKTFGVIGAAAGSLFVFKGTYRAVLINYPSRAEKDALIQRAGQASRS